ncbi:hypothetical protein [Streptomyces sp. NPDC058653]|uniref:hypothetical protein n=1 Tax=Streptomyces sp. NPDC058653 TaxID=3346576 RepID=UPI003654333F
MSHRHRLSLAVLPAVVAGAMFVPVSAAVASEAAQTPVTSVADEPPTDKTAEEKKAADAEKAAEDQKTLEMKKAEDAKKAKAGVISEEDAKKAKAGQYPKGPVAAGEAPAADGGSATLVGSAAGALLLAGAGTFVVRRRSVGRRGI